MFFATRSLCQKLQDLCEKELPLTNPSNSASVGDIVDLSKWQQLAWVEYSGIILGIIGSGKQWE